MEANWPKDGRGEPYTPERVRNHARDHVAYGWTRRPGGWTGDAWTPELTAIYHEEYDKAKAELRGGR
jgi:hypothetical protein